MAVTRAGSKSGAPAGGVTRLGSTQISASWRVFSWLLIFVAVIGAVLSSSSVDALVPWSVPLRVISFTLFLLGSFVFPGDGIERDYVWRGVLAGTVVWSIGNAIYLCSVYLMHGDVVDFLARFGSTLGFLLVIGTVIRRLPTGILVGAVVAALRVVVAGCLLMGILDPDIGLEHDRLRGVLDNSNLLGLIAAVLFLVAVRSGELKLLCALDVMLAVGAIAWTASRGALMFLGVCVVGLVLAFRQKWNTGIVLVLCFGIIAVLIAVPYLGNLAIFRTNDSRLEGWQSALQTFSQSPIVGSGVGEGGVATGIAGTLLTAMAQGGLVGAVGVIVSLVGWLRASASTRTVGTAFCFAAVAYSFVESWAISAVGASTVVLFLGWICYCASGGSLMEQPVSKEKVTRLRRR